MKGNIRSHAAIGIAFLLAMSLSDIAFSQTANAPLSAPETEQRISMLEARLNELEVQGTALLKERNSLLKSSLEQRDSLLKLSFGQTDVLLERIGAFVAYAGAFAAIFSIIFFAVTAYATYSQSTRMNSQLTSENLRLNAQSNASVNGANEVANVLKVVKSTLQDRLIASEKGAKQVADLQNKIDALTQQVTRLTKGVESEFEAIESEASELAAVPRHDFKKQRNLESLFKFSSNFDSFVARQPDGPNSLSARALYVRGVAAHFQNDLTKLQRYLTEAVIKGEMPGEDVMSTKKRTGNSNYFLGICSSNMGDWVRAVEYLQMALQDSGQYDFLSRIGAAEAEYMAGNFQNSEELLKDIEQGIVDRVRREERESDVNERNILSRAALIQTNILIRDKPSNWQDTALEYAQKAIEYSADSYYAQLTVGQLLAEVGENDDATRVFRKVHELILESGHLNFVTETRSKILLLMTAAMSCKRGHDKAEKFSSYLEEAGALTEDLPTLDGTRATVFSLLKKTNVDAGTVEAEIERFKAGDFTLTRSS